MTTMISIYVKKWLRPAGTVRKENANTYIYKGLIYNDLLLYYNCEKLKLPGRRLDKCHELV